MLYLSINTKFGDSLWFYVCRCIIHFIFTVLNIGLLLFMRKNQIGSTNATILVKIQTTFDILLNIIIPFLYCDIYEHFVNIHLARMYCYLWKSTSIFWYFLGLSLAIMILISLDRFICIVFPFRYKTIPKLKLYPIIVLTFMFCNIIPSINHIKDIIKGDLIIYNETTYTCKPINLSITALVNIIISGILPVLCVIILNVISVVILVRHAKSKIAKNMKKNTLSRKRLSIRFSVATAISISFYCAIHVINLIFIIFGLYFHNRTEFIMYYLIFVNGFMTLINPIVYMILFKNVRKFLFFFVK